MSSTTRLVLLVALFLVTLWCLYWQGRELTGLKREVAGLLDVPGYEPLITHLFQEGADYLDSDVVFGVKEELVVHYERREPGQTPDGGTIDQPWFEARYDFVLQPR